MKREIYNTWHLATGYCVKRSNKSKDSHINGYRKVRIGGNTASARDKAKTHRDNTGENRENLSSNNQQRIEKHRETLKYLVKAADSCKRSVEGLKIANGEDIENILKLG